MHLSQKNTYYTIILWVFEKDGRNTRIKPNLLRRRDKIWRVPGPAATSVILRKQDLGAAPLSGRILPLSQDAAHDRVVLPTEEIK